MSAQPEPIATTIAELAAKWNLPFPQKPEPTPAHKHWVNRLDYFIPGSTR